MMERTEQETLAALALGDHKAFDGLFRAYFAKVRFFIQGIIKSEADAEDLAQAVFVKLWTGRALIKPDRPLSPYLFTMARNAVFNYIKHKRVRSDFAQQFLGAEEGVCTEGRIHAKDMGRMVDGLIDRMPEQRGRILRLSKFIGLSNAEIAAKLDISKKTVENQLSLAVRELRRTFRN